MTKRILVCLDGSPLAESILPTIGDIGHRTGAEIVLLHVVHLPKDVPTEGRIGVDEIVAHQEREASAYLRRLASELTADGLAARPVRAIGAAAPEIVRVADQEQADMIALSTHGRSGLQRWLYGSVADDVIHSATRPLLVLRPHAGAAPIKAVRRIVAALDGSPLAERALAPARDLAKSLGVALVLLRIVDPMPTAFATSPAGGAAFGTILTALETEADGYLREAAARESAEGLTVEVLRRTGAPAEMIAAYGEINPDDLLVLSTHGRSGWRAALMGSVTRRVLLLSRGPILVIPSPAPTSP